MSQTGNLQTFADHSPNELGAALRNGRVLAIILVCLAIVFIYGYIQRANQAAELRAQIQQMEQNIEAAKLRTAALEAELRYASSDVYLDRIAREELGLAKPGETALIVVELPNAEPFGAAAGSELNPIEEATPAQPAGDLNSTARPDIPQPLWRAWFDLFSTIPAAGN